MSAAFAEKESFCVLCYSSAQPLHEHLPSTKIFEGYKCFSESEQELVTFLKVSIYFENE